MSQLTFRLQLHIPRVVRWGSQNLDRDGFFERVWQEFARFDLVGVHEGTLLSEEAAAAGIETTSWTVDSAQAPRERDWLDSSAEIVTELYFSSEQGAQKAYLLLEQIPALRVRKPEEVPPQDWDASWKASFLASPEGFTAEPNWRILPPWVPTPTSGNPERILRINPGAGFGTGTHETTKLCLKAITLNWPKMAHPRVLDFGSGSGILAIAAAQLGGKAVGVEIDPLAIDNAKENASLNAAADQVSFFLELEDRGPFDLVVANILRPVLLEFAERLCSVMRPGAPLVLSGLIEADLPSVTERYQSLLHHRTPVIDRLNEWRSISFPTSNK